MEKHKMIELWKKQFGNSYYQFNFLPKVYEYFAGQTKEISSPVTDTGRKYYVSYEEWIQQELDTDNAELARRMLVVISKMRSEGLVSNAYTAVKDVELCLRIGYDFESVIQESIHKIKLINAIDFHKIARLLAEYHPKDAEIFADRLVSDELQEMITRRDIKRDLYLALHLATILLKKDKKKYARYLPILISIREKVQDEKITVMLYEGYMLSPILKQQLQEEISGKLHNSRLIWQLTSTETMRSFLDSIGSSQWPYYYLVMNEFISVPNKPEIFHTLYQENKKVFMDLYQRLLQSRDISNFKYVPYLLAILLKNKERRSDLEEHGVILISLMKCLLNEYSDRNKEYNLFNLVDEKIPITDLEPLSFSRAFNRGNAEIIISGFSLLYDYSPKAKRFIHALLTNVLKSIRSYHIITYTAGYFLKSRKAWLDIPADKSLTTLLQSKTRFTVSNVFDLYCLAFSYAGHLQSIAADTVTPEFIRMYKKEALQLLKGDNLNIEETVVWMDLLYFSAGFDDYTPLFDLLGNKSKLIRKKAEEIINEKEETIRPSLEKKIPTLKKDALAAAKRLIKRWDNDRKFGADFVFTDNQTVIDFCTDNYDESNQKLISWISDDLLADARFVDLSGKAPAIVLKYILSEYMALEEAYKIKACDKVIERLHLPDFQATLENIYLLWKENNAETKRKMIMVLYCIYASDSQILKLKNQLKDWAEAARGAIAAFVVNAIAMNGRSVALMMIDSIAAKFPNKQVKGAAQTAFSFAAKALEIPEEVLSDKIVPTLGFDKEGTKTVDYGTRTFTLTLLPNFSLTIFDNEKQKEIKSMPAPAANDDLVKALAAKREFSELKKQIKATVQTQTSRLEKVLTNGRTWKTDAWKELFVDNPIMHRFAIGLIWGIYTDNNLTDTFRYMEDGTFNTVDEEEYRLPDDGAITLIHPSELDADTLSQWKEQLDDYEIAQPLPQLSAPVIAIELHEISDKKIIRYNGIVTSSGKIVAMAKKYNLIRGAVLDGGTYTCFHLVDTYLQMTIQLNFEYMYMGQDYNENVTLGEVIFYHLDEEGEVQDEPKQNVIIEPTTVPSRFLCSILAIFDQLKNT
ncbi:MAG: DUF4132 domain-containing protein [Bacteroides sp.]|nr:DUF4132 domain-containing protein [Bacteroides sp.]